MHSTQIPFDTMSNCIWIEPFESTKIRIWLYHKHHSIERKHTGRHIYSEGTVSRSIISSPIKAQRHRHTQVCMQTNIHSPNHPTDIQDDNSNKKRKAAETKKTLTPSYQNTQRNTIPVVPFLTPPDQTSKFHLPVFPHIQ